MRNEGNFVKIRGLSYQRGIFFIGKNHVACGYHEENRLKSWVKPLNSKTLFLMMKQMIVSMPIWFKLLVFIIFLLIFIPKWLVTSWEGLPYYTIFYVMFGTHFIFPKELKKYHGAEHKVFSERGIIKRSRLYWIKKAAITNRYCSTNVVIIYFLSVITITVVALLLGFGEKSLSVASYSSLLAIPIVTTLMEVKGFQWLKKLILSISYFFQIHVTTTEPERKHLLASIDAYRKLAEVEFPERLVEKRKEVKKMAIADVTIIPVGTDSTSVSPIVAEIHLVLKQYEGKIKYELTPMSTIIEGELPVLFEVIAKIHEVPFSNGAKRVATNIRIDDRRDKPISLEGKVESVRSKIKAENEKLEQKEVD